MNYQGTTTMTECTIMENDTPTFSRYSGSIIFETLTLFSSSNSKIFIEKGVFHLK